MQGHGVAGHVQCRPSGTARCSIGTRMAVASSTASKTLPARSVRSQAGSREGELVFTNQPSCRDGADRFPVHMAHVSAARPFCGNSPRGPPLDEQDQRHQHEDLGQHRTGPGLQQLVGDAQRQAADQGAPQIAHAAEHHHHERVDDVGLPQIGPDIGELGQRDAGDTGDAGSEPEGQCIDPGRPDAHGACHGAVLRNRPDVQAQTGALEQRAAGRRTPGARTARCRCG